MLEQAKHWPFLVPVAPDRYWRPAWHRGCWTHLKLFEVPVHDPVRYVSPLQETLLHGLHTPGLLPRRYSLVLHFTGGSVVVVVVTVTVVVVAEVVVSVVVVSVVVVVVVCLHCLSAST